MQEEVRLAYLKSKPLPHRIDFKGLAKLTQRKKTVVSTGCQV